MGVGKDGLPPHDAFRVALVGYGYWGKNLLRCIQMESRMSCVAVMDARQEALEGLPDHLVCRSRYGDLLRDVDAVIIATPPSTHFHLVKEALEAKKHVLVEKPLTTAIGDARELCAFAKEQGVILMTDHTYCYSAPVRWLRERVQEGFFGSILSISSERLNLGVFQKDVDVVLDLAAHDISIINYVLGARPKSGMRFGGRHLVDKDDDVYLHFTYPGDVSASIHVSWLYPRKTRLLTIVGSKRMAVFDDMEPESKIWFYAKGVDREWHAGIGTQVTYRHGDITIPHIRLWEPLQAVIGAFADAIIEGWPLASGPEGSLDVMEALDLVKP